MKKVHSLTTYKSFLTSLNTTITLSGNHLIYVKKSSVERFNPVWVYHIFLIFLFGSIQYLTQKTFNNFITASAIKLFNFLSNITYSYADDVSLGDEVLVDGIDGLTTATILDSYNSVMQGNHWSLISCSYLLVLVFFYEIKCFHYCYSLVTFSLSVQCFTVGPIHIT